MARRVGYFAALLFASALPLSSALAQTAQMAPGEKMVTVTAKDLVFGDIDVPGFAHGMQIAVLDGDPSKAAPYTLRLKFPDKYAFPAHYHPNAENLTVISGKFYLGMGGTVNKDALHEYHAGDFLMAPALQPHFGRVDGETIVQLHGIGPFEIKLAGQ